MGCVTSATVKPADPAICQGLADIVRQRLEQFRGSIADVDAVYDAVSAQIFSSKEPKNEEGYIDLKFDNLQVGDPGIFAIAEILRENCKVRKISFLNEELGEMAASEIGKSLRFNNICREVHVANCKMTDKAIQGLVKYFEDNDTLDSLVIKNVAANSCGGALANLLLTDAKIKQLDLRGNCLGEGGQTALVNGLRRNFRLNSVSLENNDPPLSPQIKQDIQALLVRNRIVKDCIEYIIDGSTNFKAVQDYRLDSPSDGPYIQVEKLETASGKNEVGYKVKYCQKKDAEKDYNHKIEDEYDCFPQCFAGVIADRKFNYGLADTIGRRQTMEDEILITVKFNDCPNEHVFGVFDGHGGLQCSRFVAGVFPGILQKYRAANGNDPEKNLKQTFAEIDDMCKKFEIAHGTCAVVCYFVGNELWTASVGDSRAVLCRKGGGMTISEVFKPTDKEEAERIKAEGGFVTNNGRVGGVLAVSRALGDIAFQPFVSPVPGIRKYFVEKDDDFVILGCDGVWDVYDEQQAVDMLKNVEDPRRASALLRDNAFLEGSTDNISVVVVRLNL